MPNNLENSTNEEQKRRSHLSLLILAGLVLIAFVFFLASFIYEGALMPSEPSDPPPDKAMDLQDVARARMPVDELYTLFPPDISRYATKALHDTTYSDGLKAEAIYEPEDMDLQLATPTTVYCILTVWDSKEKAADDIKETSRDFPVESDTMAIDETTVLATVGYDREKGRYFVGYHEDAMSLKIFSTYTQVVPEREKGALKHHGQNVAQEVIPYFLQGLTGAE